MKQIRQWKITRTEQKTVRVLHVPESGSGPANREPNPAAPQSVAEPAPRGWKQLLAMIRDWARRLAPALAVSLVCEFSLYGQTVTAAMSANEISSLTSKSVLTNVNNFTVPILSRGCRCRRRRLSR